MLFELGLPASLMDDLSVFHCYPSLLDTAIRKPTSISPSCCRPLSLLAYSPAPIMIPKYPKCILKRALPRHLKLELNRLFLLSSQVLYSLPRTAFACCPRVTP
ncbi:hypothetical protein AcV5_003368 [Taiwanofungus camphoratus]|nr:hypothetical protein AcV5_003368 [Antrodia cinnamomea]